MNLLMSRKNYITLLFYKNMSSYLVCFFFLLMTSKEGNESLNQLEIIHHNYLVNIIRVNYHSSINILYLYKRISVFKNCFSFSDFRYNRIWIFINKLFLSLSQYYFIQVNAKTLSLF